jgi:RNase P/RNase MRP subunit POP5
MTVKEKRGRRRYIAFTVAFELKKEALIKFLRDVPGTPYVVQCSEGWAIVRCPPDCVDTTISAVCASDPSAASLRTSGTLATLRDRYPELERLRPAKRIR